MKLLLVNFDGADCDFVAERLRSPVQYSQSMVQSRDGSANFFKCLIRAGLQRGQMLTAERSPGASREFNNLLGKFKIKFATRPLH